MNDSIRRVKAEIFGGLAHPTRIAIVEVLAEGELPAGKLAEKLNLEQANTSQHLSILRAKGIVVNRKAGNQVLYSLRDPVMIEMLDAVRRYIHSQLTGTMSMIKKIGQEKGTPKGKTK